MKIAVPQGEYCSRVQRLEKSGALRRAYYFSHAINLFRLTADVLSKGARSFLSHGADAALDEMSKSARHHFNPANGVLTRTMGYLSARHRLDESEQKDALKALQVGLTAAYEKRVYRPVLLPLIDRVLGDGCRVYRRQTIETARMVVAGALICENNGLSSRGCFVPAARPGDPKIYIEQTVKDGQEVCLKAYQGEQKLMLVTGQEQVFAGGYWGACVRASGEKLQKRIDAAITMYAGPQPA